MSSKIEKDIIQIEDLQMKVIEIKNLCQHGQDVEEAIEELRPREHNRAGLTINGIYIEIDYNKVKELLDGELKDTLEKIAELKDSLILI